MHGDLDDTRIAPPRTPPTPAPEPDAEATRVRGDLPHPPPPETPPALIEPPPPARAPLPTAAPAVPPLPPELSGREAAPAAPRFAVRLADGREVPVEGPVYVGRKPSVPRIHTGPPPLLVTVPSPSRELSATHLELRPVGSSLVATDMRSTNGTIVRLPGAAPRALLRGESIVVVPGTRLDLGDGAVLDILSPEGES